MTPNPRQFFASFTLLLALSTGGLTLTGCRVNEDDVHRWEKTEMGPMKLAAVVKHDKYPPKLRIEAAMSMIRMKPRSGKRVGIERLLDALKDLPADERKKLIGGLLPLIVAEMNKPPSTQQGMTPEEGQKAVDPSIPFKDAAFGLLIYDKAALVTEEEHKTVLRDALLSWVQADFSRRVAMSAQLYGVEQILRFYKEEGAKILPPLIKEDSAYDRMATLVAELGSPETKNLAAQKLVELAKRTESQAWFDQKKPQIDAANKAANYNVPEDRLNKQVAEFQEEQVVKVYAALKKVKGRPAVDYLLASAADKNRRLKVRQAAMAALEGALDRNNPGDAKAVAEIAAKEDTPDEVRDLAFVRIGELPREAVAKTLYELFPQKDPKKWKIRWVAAATLLKMSNTANLPEFYGKLNPLPAGFALPEPLEYGKLIGVMKPPPSKEQMANDLKSPTPINKLVAIGYFYHYGKAADAGAVNPLGDDRTALPKVEDADGKWQCPDPEKPNAMKDVNTVGEFVKGCVLPKMAAAK